MSQKTKSQTQKTPRERLLDVTFEHIYTKGYAATSIDAILKDAKIPKGSMYHYFGSKKGLVIAMIKERMFIKIDNSFSFTKIDNQVYKSIKLLLLQIARNSHLVKYGCPMYRLIVELSSVDKEFDNLLQAKYNELINNFTKLFENGKNNNEFVKSFNAKSFSKFMLSSIWGVLSLSPTASTQKSFLEQTNFILEALDFYRISS